jgi:DNA-binding CsgD family transcriptional regulator
MGHSVEGARRARQALVVATEPAARAEIHWLLARSFSSVGRNHQALETVERALSEPDVPGVWRARLLASLALFQRADTGDLDAAEISARQALRVGEDVGDAFGIAYALTSLWMISSVRRDHVAALDYVDRALETLGMSADDADLRTFVLDSRIFTMQNLDRWRDAEATLLRARKLAQGDSSGFVAPSITAAVLMYWFGRWDDALAELSPVADELAEVTYSGLRERGPALLQRGVAALIAARRDERQSASDLLNAGLNLPVNTSDRENSDFLIAAHALVAEQDGDPHHALSILSVFLQRRPGEMTLVHQWLPDIVRLALSVEDRSAVQDALRVCREEAAAESRPARADAAGNRCVGLVDRDPVVLGGVVEHYRATGPVVDLAGTLEDLAVALVAHGKMDEARNALNEAVELYDRFGAAWDIARAERRLRTLGIRRGVHGPRTRRPAFGWEALTRTEVKVAYHVGQGMSTPKIAESMSLSRRTVQTHISHILTKLGARSRVEIAREAFRRGLGEEPAEDGPTAHRQTRSAPQP